MRRYFSVLFIRLFLGIVVFGIALIATPDAEAIIIRHDRPDSKYLELGARYPAVGFVGRDGEGTLVGSRWVLTAAHVARGIPNGARHVEFGGIKYKVENVFLNPEWSGRGRGDIALLKLESEVKGIDPVHIYTGKEETGKTVVFVGRGDTGTGLTGPRTMDRKKRGATNKVERADKDWIYFMFDDPAGSAATELEGISGPGDSGGPALIEKDGRVFTIGVSVWGNPGKNGRGTYGATEGYTRVSSFAKWIEDVLAGKVAASKSPSRGPRRGEVVVTVPKGGAKLPGTAAGKRLQEFLSVLNAGDAAKIADFVSTFSKSFSSKLPVGDAAGFMRLANRNYGGFDVLHVEKSTDHMIRVILKSRKSDRELRRLDLTTEKQAPYAILSLDYGPGPTID